MNISEDHISTIEHPDFEDYFASKLKFFKQDIEKHYKNIQNYQRI